jgi:hypothetical protein
MTREPKAFRPEIDLAAIAIRQPRSTSFAAVGGGAGIASTIVASGETDLAALASGLPQSSHAASGGGGGKGSTQPPPGEIDLAALSPSARSVERLNSESSASQGEAPPPSGVPGKIDLEAIAIRVPRSRYWRDPAKRNATRQRNKAARQKQRLELRTAQRQASWEPSRGGPARWFGRPLGDRLLCAMEPGQWYAVRDLTEALGVHRNSVKPWLYGAGGRRLVGLVQKGRNRAFQGRPGPWALMGGAEYEPEFLWGLTEAGERARELALMLE